MMWRSMLTMPIIIKDYEGNGHAMCGADRDSLGVLYRRLATLSVRERRGIVATPMPCQENEIWVTYHTLSGTAEATCLRPRGDSAGCFAYPWQAQLPRINADKFFRALAGLLSRL